MTRAADPTGRRRRVGVFGGTFDPPHLGHTAVASDVADALGLDEVVWVPAGAPPHKLDADVTPADVRLRMTRAAAAVDDRFRVSDVEIARDGPSYMVDTLGELSGGELAGTELYLILGIDQYRDFDGWRDPEGIRALATLAVMDRGGEGLEPDTVRAGGDVVPVSVRRVDVSSTEVRARAERGDDISDLVPPAVARVIAEERAYRPSGAREASRAGERRG